MGWKMFILPHWPAAMTILMMAVGGLVLLFTVPGEAVIVDVIDYREPTINNLFSAGTPDYTFFSEPSYDLSQTNGLNSAKVNKFTVCFCLYFLNALPQGIKILDPTGTNWLYFRYDIDATTYYLGQGFIGNFSLVVTSYKYTLLNNQFIFIPGFNCYCLAVDLTTSTVKFSVNGVDQGVNVNIKEINHPNALILSSKILVYNEMFSMVNIYDTDLPTALAAKNGPGKLLAWNAANWTRTPIPGYQTLSGLDSSLVSGAVRQAYSIGIKTNMNNPTLMNLCNLIGPGNGGGLIQSYANKADFQSKFSKTMANLNLTFASIWIPYTRASPNNMDYVNVYDHSQKMDTTLWAPGYPAPGEDCVRCTSSSCMDDACSVKLGAHICSFPKGAPVLMLQGLCKDSLLDVAFYPDNYLRDLIWVGLSGSFVRYMPNERLWRLYQSGTGIFAVSDASPSSLLIGSSNWRIWGDYLCTTKEYEDYIMNLNSAGSDFNCANGDCVLMRQRCNGLCECPDCSDEDGCKVLDKLISYNKGILTSLTGGLAPVVFSTTVTGFGNIDDSAGLLSLSLAVSIQWYDFRLIYLNLSPNQYLNSLNQDEINSIWQPEIFYANKEPNDPIVETIIPGGTVAILKTFYVNPNSYLYSANLSSGAENPLLWSEQKTALFDCDFDVTIYPFDFQVCDIQLTLSKKQLATVMPTRGDLRYQGPESVQQYRIVNVQYCTDTVDGDPLIVIRISLSRDVFGSFMSDFLPNIICSVLGYSTIYYNNFEVSAGTNLTLLLVLVTLYLGITSTLKVTTSIKMIEVFMLLSLLLCFTDTLMQSYLHYYGPPEESDKEEDENDPDLQIAKPVRTTSAAARDMTALLSASGLYGSKMAEIQKGTGNNDPVITDLDVEAKGADPGRPLKEAIFDLAMRPESAGTPVPAVGWDSKQNEVEDQAKIKELEKQAKLDKKLANMKYFLTTVKPIILLCFFGVYMLVGLVFMAAPSLYATFSELDCTAAIMP